MSLAITNEARIQTTAREIFAATRQEKPSLLSSERWQGEMMWLLAALSWVVALGAAFCLRRPRRGAGRPA